MHITEVGLQKELTLLYGISSSGILTGLKWLMFLYFFQEDKELLSKMTPQNPFLLWLSRVKGSNSGPGHALGAQQRELLCGSRA